MDTRSKRRRRWFQFSLRTMLILTTLVAAGLGWWSYKARQQRDAVAALKKLGAAIEYDFQRDVSSLTPPAVSPRFWPRWLVDRLGVDYFANVSKVVMPKTTTDADVARLASLTQLTWVELNETQITDAALQHLHCLNVRYLGLQGTRVTDRGLVNVKRFSHLRILALGNTGISDVGLMHLGGLQRLESLELTNTRITEQGLAYLQPLVILEDLFVAGTDLTDEGLKLLKNFKELRLLGLGNDKLTDAGLAHIAEMQTLEILSLDGEMPQVTDAGMNRLKQALPQCRIHD